MDLEDAIDCKFAIDSDRVPGLIEPLAPSATRKNWVLVEFEASRTKGAAEASASFEAEAPSEVEFAEVASAEPVDMTREARRCFMSIPTFFKMGVALVTEIPSQAELGVLTMISTVPGTPEIPSLLRSWFTRSFEQVTYWPFRSQQLSPI